jgi:Domain of unknown function (DUF1844)
MAEKKNDSGFTVTDRRLFTSDGELRPDVGDEVEKEPSAGSAGKESASNPSQSAAPDGTTIDREMPQAPSNAEQEAQAAAYRESSKELDKEVEKSGHSTRDFEITFEKFMASLYMTAMLQLGLMRRQGEQPQVDIIGARQTIDTLSLLAEKTKGNLTPAEANFLQNSLYELRMAYVEVTNAIARPPQPGPATGTTGR